MSSNDTETNPFRRDSYIQARPPPAYVPSTPITPTFPPPTTTIGANPDDLLNANGSTTTAQVVILDTQAVIERPPAIGSPVPQYSRTVPQAHVIVESEIVARMPANYNTEEASARLDGGGGIDGSERGGGRRESAPPPYAPSSLPVKSAAGAQYEEEALRRVLASGSAEQVGYGVMFDVQLTDLNQIRMGHLRSAEVREANEAQRRKIERREERRGRWGRAGGLWKAMKCCVPGGGGMGHFKRHRALYICIGTVMLVLTMVIVVGVVMRAVTFKHGGSGGSGDDGNGGKRKEAQFLQVGDFPPIPTGVMIVQPTGRPTMIRTCVNPPEMWSCSLPVGAANPIPEFRFEIRHRATDKMKDSAESLWAPNPPNVNEVDYREMAKIDGLATANSSGIATPFVITMANRNTITPPNFGNGSGKKKVDNDDEEEEEEEQDVEDQELDVEAQEREFLTNDMLIQKRQSTIAEPHRNVPHMLPSLMRNQALRLMDKGLPSEHYTTHMYFQKSIYLDGLVRAPNSTTSHNNVPLNAEVHGSSPNAHFACVFSYTRFKLQIFTDPARNAQRTIVDRDGNRFGVDDDYAVRFATNKATLTDAVLPLPVTVSEDRVGGSANQFGRHLACYVIDHVGGPGGEKRLGVKRAWPELLGVGLGQQEGRQRGCLCEWGNWRDRGRLD